MTNHEKMLSGNVNPILTELARQFPQSEFVSKLLMPEMVHSKMSGRYFIFGNEHMRVHDTKRGLRASPKNMPRDDYSSKSFELQEHALSDTLDYREMDAAKEILDLKRSTTEKMMNSMLLEREKEVADLVQAQATYSPSNYTALTSTDIFNDGKSDPIQIISDMMETVRGKINRLPNVILLSQSSYNALRSHPKIIDRIAHSRNAVVNTDIIAELLSQENNKVQIVIGTGMHEDKEKVMHGDQEKVMHDIWGNVCIGVYNQFIGREVSNYDQAFGKMILRSGFPKVEEFRTNGSILTHVQILMQYKAVITQKDAGFLIADTIGEIEGGSAA